MSEVLKTAVNVPLYKSKGVKAESNNSRGIISLNVIGKIYEGIFADRGSNSL